MFCPRKAGHERRRRLCSPSLSLGPRCNDISGRAAAITSFISIAHLCVYCYQTRGAGLCGKECEGIQELSHRDEEDDSEEGGEDENIEADEMVKAFLGHSGGKEPARTICYEDVNLLLLLNPTGIRNLLTLEIDLWYTKGHQRQTKR